MRTSQQFATIPSSWIQHDRSVRQYVNAHRVVGSMKFALVSLFFLTIVLTRWALAYQWELQTLTSSLYLQWVYYFCSMGVILRLLTLPFSFFDYSVERKYKVSNQSAGSWFADECKATLVAALLGFLAFNIMFVSISLGRDYWWVLAWAIFCFFSIVIAKVFPIMLLPLFIRLRPMKEGSIRARLERICAEYNIIVEDIYHLELSEKTTKGNAAFVGIGNTKRILIGDTLYTKYSEDEVAAVFGHELGHQVANDMWKGIILNAVLLFLNFASASLIFYVFKRVLLGEGVEAPFGMLMYLVIFAICRFPLDLVQALYSRFQERRADRFAAESLKLGPALARALEKLTIQNKVFFKPNPVIEYFTFSHPAPWRRIFELRHMYS